MPEWWDKISSDQFNSQMDSTPENITKPEFKIVLKPERTELEKAQRSVDWKVSHGETVDENFPSEETDEANIRTERATKAVLERSLSALAQYRSFVKPMGEDSEGSR